MQEALHSRVQVKAIVLREDASFPLTSEQALLSYQASPEQFSKLTDQPNPEGILAILEMPEAADPLPADQPAVFLDSLQDPGNVGAILRVADWFGIRHIMIGPGTVDIFHPKVIRASMGSAFRMEFHPVSELAAFLQNHSQRLMVADLEGESLTANLLESQSILVVGNEANGVSERFRVDPHIRKIRIPGGDSTESLNAAVATGILIWEWRKGLLP